MVFLSLIRRSTANFKSSGWSDKYWKRRQIFLHTSRFSRRPRNVWKFALRRFRRALQHATRCRKEKEGDARDLNIARLSGSCAELGTDYDSFMNGLVQADVRLDRKSLTHLAIWEPRTFKALTSVSNGVADAVGPPPDGVLTRGML